MGGPLPGSRGGRGGHFLGTIITLNQTTDAVDRTVLELIDGQQRATTLTLLLAAIHSVLKEHGEDLDEDAEFEMTNLNRELAGRDSWTAEQIDDARTHHLAGKVIERFPLA